MNLRSTRDYVATGGRQRVGLPRRRERENGGGGCLSSSVMFMWVFGMMLYMTMSISTKINPHKAKMKLGDEHRLSQPRRARL